MEKFYNLGASSSFLCITEMISKLESTQRTIVQSLYNTQRHMSAHVLSNLLNELGEKR